MCKWHWYDCDKIIEFIHQILITTHLIINLNFAENCSTNKAKTASIFILW